MTEKYMLDAHETWLAAKRVIETFLRDIAPGMSPEHLDHNSSAILARLAQHDPPLLVARADELKE